MSDKIDSRVLTDWFLMECGRLLENYVSGLGKPLQACCLAEIPISPTIFDGSSRDEVRRRTQKLLIPAADSIIQGKLRPCIGLSPIAWHKVDFPDGCIRLEFDLFSNVLHVHGTGVPVDDWTNSPVQQSYSRVGRSIALMPDERELNAQ